MGIITVGVLTVSDECALNDEVNEVGPNLVQMLKNNVIQNAEVVKACLLPNSRNAIEWKLKQWIDRYGIRLIFIAGGTGRNCDNVIEQATQSLLERKLLGIIELLNTRHGTCGFREHSVIVNLPFNVEASSSCLRSIAEEITSAMFLLSGSKPLTITRPTVTWKNERRNGKKISINSASKKLMAQLGSLKTITTVNVKEGLGFVIAEDVLHRTEVSQWDVSSVYGYAVLASDSATERNVIGFCESGRPPPQDLTVIPGTCVEVVRTAGIPTGADAVIDFNDVATMITPNGKTIRLRSNSISEYQNIIRRGSPTVIVNAETCLNDSLIDILKLKGITSVNVYARPFVAVFSIGQPTKTRLLKTLKNEGFYILDFGAVTNDADSWLDALLKGFKSAPVVITVGVSQGDPIFEVLERYFNSQVFSTGNTQHDCFFARVSLWKEEKIWFGFPTPTILALHLLILPVLYNISGLKKTFSSFFIVTSSRELQESYATVQEESRSYEDFLRWLTKQVSESSLFSRYIFH